MPVGFCPSGLLSSGLLSQWAFVLVGFYPTLTIQTRGLPGQIILLCWTGVPLEKDHDLKTKFTNKFSF